MIPRYFSAAGVVITTALVCSAPAFAQTDLKTAAISISKDIHADKDVTEKLKDAKIFIAPFVNRKTPKDGKKDDTPSVLIDMLATEFINKKHFKVVEREQMDKALKELALGESGFVDTTTAKKLGKFVGAEYGLIGTISEVEGTTLIAARLVSIETGEAIVAAEATPGLEKGKTIVLVPPPTKPGPKPTEPTAPPPGPDAIGKVAMNPIDKAELVYVPAGEFIMGRPKDEDNISVWNTFPQHEVYLDGYWIYKYPVTVAQYRKFCEATGKKLEGRNYVDDCPVMDVSWSDAMAYCKWAGVTLPTEAQWEKAARGTTGQKFPWGDQFDRTKLWASIGAVRESPVPVHRETYKSESPFGCIDMLGNVKQWCLDFFERDYYEISPLKNPKGPEFGTQYSVRGIDYTSNRVKYVVERDGYNGDQRYLVGFRCVIAAQAP